MLTITYPHKNIVFSDENKACTWNPQVRSEYTVWEQQLKTAIRLSKIDEQYRLISEYRNYIQKIQTINKIESRKTLYSSILEEIPIHLFVNNPNISITSLKSHNSSFFLGKACCTVASTGITKNVDFSFGVTQDKNNYGFIFLETKRYIDKTMLDTILATYKYITSMGVDYIVVFEEEARTKFTLQSNPNKANEFWLSGKNRPPQKERKNRLTPFAIRPEIYTLFVDQFNKYTIDAYNKALSIEPNKYTPVWKKSPKEIVQLSMDFINTLPKTPESEFIIKECENFLLTT
jgi:hypothetical protein